MVKKKQQKSALLAALKEVKIKLLPYKGNNSIQSLEQKVSKEKAEMPLFDNRPIHKGKKHEFF